jgi:hypothetical protein
MENPPFSRHIFWDTDYDSIDWENKARYVIERVVMFGNLRDWRIIQSFYGMETIKEAVLQARDLDPKTLNFMSQLFNIPVSEFRCFIYRQSNHIHWQY